MKRNTILLEIKYKICQKKLSGSKPTEILKEFNLASSTVLFITNN